MPDSCRGAAAEREFAVTSASNCPKFNRRGVNSSPPAPLWDMNFTPNTDHTAVTIAVIDDDEITRSFLADNLTADGYQVLEAGMLSAAHRLTSSRFIDLAIVDLGLPDGDGLE